MSCRSLSVTIVVFAALALNVCRSASAEEFVIADRQVTPPAIYTPAEASDSLKACLAELADIVQKMCGQRPEIVTQLPATRAIVVGAAGQFPDAPRVTELKGVNPEGFVLHSTAQRLFIVGNTELAAQQGVFTLLRRLGCRWFFPHEAWTVIPQREALRIDVSLVDAPDYDYRRIWYGWGPRTPKLKADYDAWIRHNRQYGWFRVDCGHAYERFCPRKLAEAHPEYFALVDGKRPGNQLCTTNPEVIRLATEYALAAFDKDPSRIMVSLEPNDGLGYCECEQCKAVGTVSDCVFRLANQVAEALAAKHPGKYVGLLAYSLHTEPPAFDLLPNVYVQLTTGFRRTKMTFEEQMAAFSKRARSLGVYDYFSVFPWDRCMPGKGKAADLEYLKKAIPQYHQLGATTLDAESSCSWGPHGPGYYLAAQLMWDTQADADAIVDEFYTTAFGDAAGPVRRFYQRWQQKNELSERTLSLSYRDLNEATRATSDPQVQARLDHLKLYLHFCRLSREFTVAKQPEQITQKGHELIQFSRRIMDTGLIHSFPLLFTEWFDTTFKKLTDQKTVTPETLEAWKKERTDVPDSAEVASLFEDGLKLYGGLEAVDVPPTVWSTDLAPVGRAASPALMALLGDLPESPLYCEKGVYYLSARAGEKVTIPMIPYPNHTVAVHYVLTDVASGQVAQEGDIQQERNQSAELTLSFPQDGLYSLNPGTDYWKACRLGFPRRPLVVEASRDKAFMLWLPKLTEPLYFWVPSGAKSFVLRLHSAGTAGSEIRVYAPDGTVANEGKDLPGGTDISVTVPAGADGRIWAFGIKSLRSTIQLLGVPPFLARHPDELMAPRECLKPQP